MANRREFIQAGAGSAASALGAALLTPQRAAAEATVKVFAEVRPVVDLSSERIVQITMVVKDAARVATRFTEVYGTTWNFYEFRPGALVLYGWQEEEANCVLRMAIGSCGGYSFKLVQPASDQSSHADFLDRHGEGFYSIGLAPLRNYAAACAALKAAGVEVEMQGDVGNGAQFTIWNTAPDIGCRVELTSVPQTTASAFLTRTGHHYPRGPSLIDMTLPYLSGGRQFTKIGLVVEDAARGAQRFAELFGIRDWRFQRIPVVEAALLGEPLARKDLPSATVTQGVACWGGAQLEILAPVEQGPGGIHRQFLDEHGRDNGFQRLMISPPGGDHTALLDAFKKAGFAKAWEAAIEPGGVSRVRGDYIDMREELGGFLLEFNG